MPVELTEVLAEIDALLGPERFEDYCVNGLQVPGAERVATVATGVSAHAELFSLAAAEGADLVLVHHGLFWGPGVQALDEVMAQRLRLLLEPRIALAAYHLPLDAHPQVGNNALLAAALGAGDLEPFALHRGQPIGLVGTLPAGGLALRELVARVAEATAREPLLLPAAGEQVERLAVVTGAGADYIPDAAAAGAQALITGEPVERATALAREHGVHLIAAGHHATETFGIRRLGEHVSERFGVRHVFLDVPNPV